MLIQSVMTTDKGKAKQTFSSFFSSADWERARVPGGLHQPFDEDRDEHFHRKSRGSGLFCDTPLPPADRRLGCNRNLVSRRSAVQSRDLFPGRCVDVIRCFSTFLFHRALSPALVDYANNIIYEECLFTQSESRPAA